MLEEPLLAPHLFLIFDLSSVHPSLPVLYFLSLPLNPLYLFVPSLCSCLLLFTLLPPCAASLSPSHVPWQQTAVLVTLVAWCSRRTGGRPHPASLLHPSTGLQSWRAS